MYGIGDNVKIYNSYNIGEIKNNEEITSDNRESINGGIVGFAQNCSEIKYCYNLGSINIIKTTSSQGGIAGRLRSALSSNEYEKASSIQNCYNSNNVTSQGEVVGGICGLNYKYCSVKYCYVSAGIKVKDTTTKINSTEGIIGQDNGISSDNEVLQNMPTVYEVVNANTNGINNGDSQYWSKTEYSNADLQTPKLIWESNVK